VTGGGNYCVRNLTLNAETGVFSGSLVTNACPNHAGAYEYNGVRDVLVRAASASCQKWTLPVAAYAAAAGSPKAAPLRSGIGYTISGGETIYGPMDAGFAVGQVCSVAHGTCPAGTDTRMCGALIERACGTANLKGNTSASMHMLLSDCGGHAGYHNHEALACEYSAAAAGHSALVGVLLDGRGLYGQFESAAARPADLDACNGHYGPTPATTVGADAYAATASTYHYHLTVEAPFTAGCFGPVASLAAAKALYASCAAGGAACSCAQTATCACAAGAVMTDVCTSLGLYASYTLDCPVYSERAAAQVITNDARCVPCAGNCAAYGSTALGATGTRTRTGTRSPPAAPAANSPSASPTPTGSLTAGASPSATPSAPAAPASASAAAAPGTASRTPSASPTPAAAVASATLALSAALPAAAFSGGRLAVAAVANLTRALAAGALAAGCAGCSVRVTRAFETATGVVVLGDARRLQAPTGVVMLGDARRLQAPYGALSIVYEVRGSAAGVAAAASDPSAAFSAALNAGLGSDYGVSGVAVSAAAAGPGGAATDSSKLIAGVVVGGSGAVIAVALLGWLYCRKKRAATEKKNALTRPSTGALEKANPLTGNTLGSSV
jgi:hypothetical protein